MLALLLLPVLLHAPHLTGWLSENPAYLMSGIARGVTPGHGLIPGYPGWIDGNAGVTTQALGGLAAADWLRGIVPWWNPSSGVGLPLAAEMQNSAFFLPFVLLLRLFDGVVFLKIVLQIIAGVSCAALLRELKLNRLPVLAGALCFELNGSFAWFSHGPIMPIAFLPLLLFGIERARARPWQGALLTGVAIGWSLLAGFPETAYLDGLLGLAWATLRATNRRATTAAVIAGGLAGVLLAMPPLLAFVQSLPISFLGHHTDFGMVVFTPANRAMLAFPYLFGPPMYGAVSLTGPASLAQYLHWFGAAGYLDLPLLCLAAIALRRGATLPPLRLLLAAWLIVGLSRAVGMPGLSALVDLIPLVRNTMFHLYILPSCQMAATILAALALQDWQDGLISRRRAALCTAAVVTAGLAMLPGAWPAIAALRQIRLYPLFPILSVAVGSAAAILVGFLAARPPTRALPILLVAHAALLCFLPLLSGTPRPRALDSAAIAWLAAEPGPTRLNAVASLTPNYAAWFGLAAIDHNYLPVPQSWVDDVRATLLPGMDGVNNFTQSVDPATLAALRARLPALAAHAVTHLLLPAGIDPFTQSIAPSLSSQGSVPRRLTTPFTASLPGAAVPAGQLTQARVQIGTYAGAASGRLHLRVCQAERCTDGITSLAHAADNADLPIPLAPLDLTADIPVTLTFDAAPATSPPPAVWLWPQRSTPFALAPRVSLQITPLGVPRPAYADDVLTIFRLPAPAPYVSAPGCRLAVSARTALQAECPAPAILLRRELAYPGWKADLDGRPTPIVASGIYQSIRLPAGPSSVRFAYAPPGAGYAWAASAAGATLLLAFAWFGWGRSSGRSAMIGRSTNRLIT